MKRSEVTVENLKKMGYKAKVYQVTWNAANEFECGQKTGEEVFELVAEAAREGKKVDIRRNHVRGTVIATVDGMTKSYRGTELSYFLERKMSDAEILEESLRSGLFVSWNR